MFFARNRKSTKDKLLTGADVPIPGHTGKYNHGLSTLSTVKEMYKSRFFNVTIKALKKWDKQDFNCTIKITHVCSRNTLNNSLSYTRFSISLIMRPTGIAAKFETNTFISLFFQYFFV